eukprot:CAMPEP_0178768774 /NCGR_PEP_ID=MMETSP0744-20121128/20438_1 /TAXON_ID=913974 /ORGANISM="Nitzschia punctata, Strain CCMP561" /LENGTH=497 /DNA_ID=CAMNT_0020424907 /DNA_START=36 /DNA_END=1530 /DNA_ORIENTATION=-
MITEDQKIKAIRGRKLSSESKKTESKKPSPNELVSHLTLPLLRKHSTSGRITFAATRTLARRLKRPLCQTLNGLQLFEVQELGHRLSNDLTNHADVDKNKLKYSDWEPVTDTTIANSMASDGILQVGGALFFEDDEHNSIYVGSLNVEELAMEYYRKGRLPVSHEGATVGGWVGYHDEGSKIRALFRILSSEILGMDWALQNPAAFKDNDYATIHLTPYQGAPFDLHVGAEMAHCTDGGEASVVEARGIYMRRRSSIDGFLGKLASLNSQDVSDLVYDSINSRLEYTKSTHHTDPALECDLDQVRTLSMLAAGFGGKMLSSIFRCLFFDYRHYSGGLPDLLLVRALYCTSGQLVDLGEWIGECFSSEYQSELKAKQVSEILGDRDEEFLGCSKVGDSGARSSNRFKSSVRRGSISARPNGTEILNQSKEYKMPDRLRLEHNDQKVKVECMCVEVKSQNDRLDPRQEDWLNILDQHGNARVCKFQKPKHSKSKTRARY